MKLDAYNQGFVDTCTSRGVDPQVIKRAFLGDTMTGAVRGGVSGALLGGALTGTAGTLASSQVHKIDGIKDLIARLLISAAPGAVAGGLAGTMAGGIIRPALKG